MKLHAYLLPLFALSSFVAFGQTEYKEKLDSLFDILEANNMSMNSVSIFENGSEVYARSIGFENVEKDIQASGETKYRIGSISKTFTATMIVKLADAGALSLGDKLSDFYPQIENAEDISIEDLLRHQSGIFNFTNADDFSTYMYTEQSKEQLLERIAKYGSVFKPREKSEYSNSNYVLLTFILEDVSGVRYSELLKEEICEPCALLNTYLGSDVSEVNHEAYSYFYGGEWTRIPSSDMSIPLGAGAIISTPKELNQFYTCLFKGYVLERSSVTRMATDVNGYGMGMFPHTYGKHEGYGHTGGIDGFQSHVVYFPEDHTSFAITVNGPGYEDIMEAMVKIYHGEEFELPTIAESVEVDPALLEAYAGAYKSDNFPLAISVSLKEGELVAQATGQGAFPLRAESNTRFVFNAAGIVMTFNKEENSFTLEQGGGTYLFVKQ